MIDYSHEALQEMLVWLEGAVLGRPLWLICWLMDFQEYETLDPQTHLLEFILLACICFFRNSINTEEIFNTRDCEANGSSNCLLPPPCLLHHRHIPNPREITTRQWLKLTGTLWELHFSLVIFSSNSRAKNEEPNWDGCLFTQTWELGTKRALLLFGNSK